MDTRYSFALLRYVHDIVSGEFVNVGIILYAPDKKYLAAKCVDSYARLSRVFQGVEGPLIRRMLRSVEDHVEDIAERLQSELQLDASPSGLQELLGRIIPKDDSALQFSTVKGGITRNPQAMFEAYFLKYVSPNIGAGHRVSRSDEEVLKVFRKSLVQRRVIDRLQRKTITAKYYEHEFPIAWKNGVWHTSEAVSFDLQDPIEIVEKANRWVGRVVSLRETGERFKLHLLIGGPQDPKLGEYFNRAKGILEQIPGEHSIVLEDQSEAFADLVARDIEAHSDTGG